MDAMVDTSCLNEQIRWWLSFHFEFDNGDVEEAVRLIREGKTWLQMATALLTQPIQEWLEELGYQSDTDSVAEAVRLLADDYSPDYVLEKLGGKA